MSKKPTKKDLEQKISELEKSYNAMANAKAWLQKDLENSELEVQKVTKKSEEELQKCTMQRKLWQSAYYDLKDRTGDLYSRMDAVREMLTTGIKDLPEEGPEREEQANKLMNRLLEYVLRVENKVHLSLNDAIQQVVDKLNTQTSRLLKFIS